MRQVAIIIPTMDNRAYLEPCLDSLFAHTRGIEYTVYVINNGDPGGWAWMPTPVQYIAHGQGNIGWERALQLGLDSTTSPLVLFLNDDVLFLRTQRDWLTHLVADMDDP